MPTASGRVKGMRPAMGGKLYNAIRVLMETLHLQTDDLSGGLYARLGWRPLERVHYIGREVLVMENVMSG